MKALKAVWQYLVCLITNMNQKKLKIKLKKTKLQIDNCYDKLTLQKREEKYARKVTFQQMVKKHALGRCSCKRKWESL